MAFSNCFCRCYIAESNSSFFRSLGRRIQRLKGKAQGIELEADFGKGVDRVEEIAPPEKPQIETDNTKKLNWHKS